MDELVTVATYDSLPIAEIDRLRLIDEGISAVLADANAIAMNSFLSFAIGGIKLCVLQSDLDRAESILSKDKFQPSLDASPDSTSIRFYCDDCGTVLDFPSSRRGGVEHCNNCGEYVDVPGCSDATLVADDGSPIVPPSIAALEASAAAANRRIPLLLEIVAVLSFVYFPHAVYSLPIFDFSQYDLATDMTVLFVGSVQSAIPLLLIMALCGEGWKKFGIVPFRWLSDGSMALGVWFVTNLVLTFAYAPFAMPSSDSPPENVYVSSWQGGLLCLLGLTANSVAEELAMRGYLITRLEELWRSRWVAVAVSSVLFASYHAYQGLWSVVAIGILGLVYGLFFIWQRRLWPLIIAHTLYNLTAYF